MNQTISYFLLRRWSSSSAESISAPWKSILWLILSEMYLRHDSLILDINDVNILLLSVCVLIVREEITLWHWHTHYVVRNYVASSIVAIFNFGAQDLLIKAKSGRLKKALSALLSNEFALTAPDLNLSVFQSQEFLFLIKKYESLRCFKTIDVLKAFVPAVINSKALIFLFDHDFFIKLLQKFDLESHPIKFKISNLLSRVYVNKGHWNQMIIFNLMK